MVISDKWSCYRDDDIGKAKFVKDKLLDDFWWDQVDYILSFTAPIYDMIRVCDTDRPSLHLVYDMWDTMIEKVKMVIYKHEGKQLEDESTFYNVVHQILVDRWNKNNTPLHCLAHSLNPRYYSDVWLHEDPSRVPPHRDEEVCLERKKCLKRFFDDPMERTKANLEYTKFSTKEGPFADIDSIGDRCDMDPHSWWVVHGASAPTLQSLALRLLVQPSSSSCAERNWSIYSFIHSMRRNKMTPQRAEDLVFVHSNLRLLSRRTPQYHEGETKLWDIAGDTFDSFDDVGMLEVANLSLDEPEMEVVLFTDDGGANEEKGGKRFQGVCRDWTLQISTPFFAHNQSLTFQAISGLFCQSSGGDPPSFISIDPQSCGVPDPSLKFLPEPIDIRASSNGLICCQG
ncbi:unnamed protein product [Camellia sinensis]